MWQRKNGNVAAKYKPEYATQANSFMIIPSGKEAGTPPAENHPVCILYSTRFLARLLPNGEIRFFCSAGLAAYATIICQNKCARNSRVAYMRQLMDAEDVTPRSGKGIEEVMPER